jgi:hypothetical protein
VAVQIGTAVLVRVSVCVNFFLELEMLNCLNSELVRNSLLRKLLVLYRSV